MGEDSRTDGTVVTDAVGLMARPLYHPIYKTLPHTTPTSIYSRVGSVAVVCQYQEKKL